MDADERRARVDVLNLAAGLVAPNRSIDGVITAADKLWAWANGEKPPASKVSKAIDKGLAKLSASQGAPIQASE